MTMLLVWFGTKDKICTLGENHEIQDNHKGYKI